MSEKIERSLEIVNSDSYPTELVLIAFEKERNNRIRIPRNTDYYGYAPSDVPPSQHVIELIPPQSLEKETQVYPSKAE